MAQMGNDTKATAPATKNAKKENPHAGHRQRLKDRFVSEGGLEHFELHNVLEILLFFGIPQKDTNEIAHELIRTFGSFPQVFLADVEQLAAVKGMTRNAAILIKLVPEVYRRYMDESQEKEEILDTTDKIREYLIPKFTGRSEEIVYLLCMNNACKLLRAEIISKGSKSMAHVDLRKLAEIVFQCGAVRHGSGEWNLQLLRPDRELRLSPQQDLQGECWRRLFRYPSAAACHASQTYIPHHLSGNLSLPFHTGYRT